MLNAITVVNYIQSVFPQYKLQQSKVTNKTITDTQQYQNYEIKMKVKSKYNETNSHNMLHIDQSFNLLSTSFTKWSNTLKQFVGCCQQIV